MIRSLQIVNILTFVLTIAINYLSNTGILNNTTIGEVSAGIRTLFTPAGFAFAIWGLIYLLLLGFVIYQSRGLFSTPKQSEIVSRTGWWFAISCLANSLWVFAWIYGHTGLSVICIFALLYSLLRIVINHRMELWDAPIGTIVFLWWPFVIYSGWVTVASIANMSAWLFKVDWNGWGLSAVFWTVLMIGIATLLNLWLTWTRNLREFAVVGAWALYAIAVANEAHEPTLYSVALTASVILLLSSAVHAWKNRATNPIIKFRQFLENR